LLICTKVGKVFMNSRPSSLFSPLVKCGELKALPQLIVFDLDHCLWLPEMYTLDEIPTKGVSEQLLEKGVGVIAAISGNEQIRLFPEALRVLQAIQSDEYPSIRIAAASSADTQHAVRIALAAMNLLEIVPGVTMREVFRKGWDDDFNGNVQIGRTAPLSADKARTHFPLLRQTTGVHYDQMVFFDDCNWGDHCQAVERGCPGVVTRKTPNGLTIQDWNAALVSFAKSK
jgi:magnesium-dependent phosphatase 1